MNSPLLILQVRAVWYLVEICLRENDLHDIGLIAIVWEKNSTIWDYDNNFHNRFLYCIRHCWPLKNVPRHICCPPKMLIRILKPILFALVDKEARCRMLVHDVDERDIVEVLARYGIMKHMLPAEMGGTVKLDQVEWIANRRAVEMEEI